jgi:hypothetical protein
MKTRIKELAEQAGFNPIQRGDHTVYDISTEENIKQFAELIIRECASQVNFTDLGRGMPYGDLILKHFGVE